MSWVKHWRLLDWMLAVLHWREFEGETITIIKGNHDF